MKITDKQVAAAVRAAQDEIELWKVIYFGDAGSRIIREPKIELSVEPSAGQTIAYQMWPIPETGDSARTIFNNMRTDAGMRKALETICPKN